MSSIQISSFPDIKEDIFSNIQNIHFAKNVEEKNNLYLSPINSQRKQDNIIETRIINNPDKLKSEMISNKKQRIVSGMDYKNYKSRLINANDLIKENSN